MSLPMPELDDLDYDHILEEALDSIARYAPEWTDRNPSDPGIMILELLAWVGEALLYRVDQVPDKVYLNFLRLLAGLQPGEVSSHLAEYEADPTRDPDYLTLLRRLAAFESGREPGLGNTIQAAAAEYLKAPYRVVTEADIQDHFQAALAQLGSQNGGLLQCRPRMVQGELRLELLARELSATCAQFVFTRTDEASCLGTFEPQMDASLSGALQFMQNYFKKRKPLGTRLRVGLPPVTRLQAELRVTRRPFADVGETQAAAARALVDYFDPMAGAFAHTPLDALISIPELRFSLLQVPGILDVPLIDIRAVGPDDLRREAVSGPALQARGIIQLNRVFVTSAEI